MNRRHLLIALAGTGIVTASGCSIAGKRLPTYRYRLSVEVDTPEGRKVGSGVIEVSVETAGSWKRPDANALSVTTRGEAITVDLGQRGDLFALLGSFEHPGWAGSVMEFVTPRPGNASGHNDYEAWHERMISNRGVHELPRLSPNVFRSGPPRPNGAEKVARDYPLLVHFRNNADPSTIERVHPYDLEATFGPGVTLRRITVQLTDEPVTSTINAKLPWLKGGLPKALGGDFHPEGIPVGGYRGLFSTAYR